MILKKVNIAPFTPPTRTPLARELHSVSFLRIKTKKHAKDKPEQHPSNIETTGQQETTHFDDSEYFQQHHFDQEKQFKFNKKIKCPHQIISIRMCSKNIEQPHKNTAHVTGAAARKLSFFRQQFEHIHQARPISHEKQPDQIQTDYHLKKAHSNYESSTINKILKTDDPHFPFYTGRPTNSKKADISPQKSCRKINPYTQRQYLHNLAKKQQPLYKKQESLGSFSIIKPNEIKSLSLIPRRQSNDSLQRQTRTEKIDYFQMLAAIQQKQEFLRKEINLHQQKQILFREQRHVDIRSKIHTSYMRQRKQMNVVEEKNELRPWEVEGNSNLADFI